MAVVTTAVAAGVTAAAAVGSAVSQRKAAKKAERAARKQGESEEEYARRQAALIKKQAGDEVEKIRRAATEFRAMQLANQAASGIMVGVGSAQTVQDNVQDLAEQDVLLTMENAEEGVLMKMEEGRMARMAGNAQAGAYAAQGRAAVWSAVGAIGSLGVNLAGSGVFSK